MGGERVGGHRPIVWGGESNDKKINNLKYIVALDGHWLIILHTTNNQKQTLAIGENREDVRLGGRRRGSANATFGGIKI
jgi:hypothetical protein